MSMLEPRMMHSSPQRMPVSKRIFTMSRTTGGGLFGVGFSAEATDEARHGSGKLNCSNHFRLPEKTHAPPSWTLSVERHRWQAISAFEQADGRLFGVVEPRHDRGSVVFVDRRCLGLGADLEGKVLHPARTAPRSVPRRAGQSRRQAGRTGLGHLLGTVAELGCRRLAQQATGVGLGCDHARTTLHRFGGERPVSWLCGSGGLENIEG